MEAFTRYPATPASHGRRNAVNIYAGDPLRVAAKGANCQINVALQYLNVNYVYCEIMLLCYL